MEFFIVVIVGVLLFLGIRHFQWVYQWCQQWLHQWQEPWEGVVIGKYTYMTERSERQNCAVELCYNQTVKIQEITTTTWKQLEIGDYVEKKVRRGTVEKRSMSDLETERVTQALAERLSLDDEGIRSRAVYALGRIGIADESVIAKLVQTLKNDTERLRSRAASALGQIGESSQKVLPRLIEALADEAARVRMNAAWALGEMDFPAPAVVSALARTLKDDEDPKVQFNIVQALKKIGTPEAMEALSTIPESEGLTQPISH